MTNIFAVRPKNTTALVAAVSILGLTVHKRQLLLIEDDYVRQVLVYTLAHYVNEHNLDLHAIIVEGNHVHRVDTDPKGNRPDFLRDFHSFVARQLNRYYKEGDAFFLRQADQHRRQRIR